VAALIGALLAALAPLYVLVLDIRYRMGAYGQRIETVEEEVEEVADEVDDLSVAD
jgi:hypothetical protein